MRGLRVICRKGGADRPKPEGAQTMDPATLLNLQVQILYRAIARMRAQPTREHARYLAQCERAANLAYAATLAK
jgi:hypothetical protein